MPAITKRFSRDESRAQGEDTLGASLSHPEYRSIVMRESLRSGRRPSTRDLYLAQRRVDASLGKSSTTIQIPGAAPGRRTI
jgi:hypothetical protein